MAITFVGSYAGTHNATSAQTVNLSNLRDSADVQPTLQQGDLVVVGLGSAAVVDRTQAQLTPTGYTPAHTDIYQNDSFDTNLLVSYKFMGPSPDTTISIPASTGTSTGMGYTIHVFRGVDASTPLDVSPTTANAGNTGVANPPAITPITAGAWILEVGAASTSTGAGFTRPADLSATTNHWRAAQTGDTLSQDIVVGAGLKVDWASGAFDGVVFGGSTTTNTGSWCAATVALRPTPSAIEAGGMVLEADDTAAGAAVAPIKAGSSIVEADDTAAGALTVVTPSTQGEAAIIEADDTATGAAVTPDRAIAAIVEADDVAAGVLVVTTTATEADAAIIEADDTAAGAAVTPDRAIASIVEASDTASGTAVTPDRALAAIIEADDTATGTVAAKVQAGASILEADDVATGAAVTPDRATAAIVEADDQTQATFAIGETPLSASGAITEADDTTLGAVIIPLRGGGNLAEVDDVAVGAVALPITGQLAVNDNDDIAVGAAVTPDRAAAAIVEADDVASGVIGETIIWDIPAENVAIVGGRSRVAGSVANRFRSVIPLPQRNRSARVA